MSTPQVPEDQLIDLLLHLKKTPPDQARTILNSQPQIAYALITLMTKMNAINGDVTQKTLATFGTLQNGVPPPASTQAAAIPPHMTPQPSRGGTPLYPTPPPISYPPQAAPSNYLTYPTGGMPQPQPNAYGAPPQAYAAPPPAVPTIPDALAAMPEEQRAMIMSVISMTQDQINRLPPAERASVIQLRTSLGVS